MADSLFKSAMSTAADTTVMQAGGESFVDQLGNALTYGAGAAVVSGLGSIYNTAAAGINALGGSVDEIDTYNKLNEIDTNWAQYYQENKNAIDTVGFIGTSFIPGGLAVKGLNLARAGNVGGAFGRALGFARTQQAASLDRALGELAVEGGTVFTRINKNKAAAMAWGFADNTLTAAAFETGVALTMKQSPLLADDSWWDIGKSAFVNAAFGGVLGGSIDSLVLNGSFKTAVKQLDKKQRGYDYIADLQNLSLDVGDKAYAITDSLLKLPKSVLSEDKVLDLSFHLSGGKVNRQVDISKVLGTSLAGAEKTALLDFETVLRDLSTDSTVTSSFAEFALRKFAKLRASGAPDAYVRDSMGDILYELKGVKAATEAPTVAADQLHYFNKIVTPEQRVAIKTVEDWQAAIVSDSPFTSNAYSKPYVFLGSAEQKAASFGNMAKIGVEGDAAYPTLSAAWKAGHDVALMPDGAIRVNDASKLWRRVEDPVYKATRNLNTRSGAITDDAVLTAADRLPSGVELGASALKKDAVYLPTKAGTRVVDMKNFNPVGDTEYFTARHAWASKLSDEDFPAVVDIADFSLMDRLRSVQNLEKLASIEIRQGDNVIGNAMQVPLSDVIKSSKLSEAQRLFADAAASDNLLDVRTVAYQLNVDPQWLETAVANRFSGAPSAEAAGTISLPLESYLRRENLQVEFARPQQFQELNAMSTDMTWQQKRNLIMESADAAGSQFVTGELAWGYRVQQAIQVTKNAAASVLGAERVGALQDLTQTAAKLADSSGVGASLLGSSNAGYGDTLKLAVQDIGKNVHNWIQQDVDAVVSSLGTPANRIRANPAAAAELGVVTNMLRATDDKYIWHPFEEKTLLLRELKPKAGETAETLAANIAKMQSTDRRVTIALENDEVAEFLKTHSGLNFDRVSRRTVLNTARGFTSNMDPETVYVPPIDTTYFRHFAFVRPIEGKAFGTSEVAMVFGRDAGELNKRIAGIDRNNFDVIPKGSTEKFFKAKDLYDFDLTINEPRINSELKKTGALNNFQPEVRAENLVEDYMRWHQNQASRLVRDAVETNYAQQVAELRKLGETYTDVATSQFSGTLRSTKSEIVNPYDDYVKTMLDVSKRSEYTFLHQANEFVDALGTRAYQAVQAVFGDAQKGMVTWEQANATMEKFGIKGIYNNQAEFFAANTPRDRNIVREYVSKANALLANTVLRMDFFNSIVNVISTPIMLGTELASIRNLAAKDPATIGALGELTSLAVPGGGRVPNTTKLISQSVSNFFGADKDMLIARYRANGDIKDTASQFHSMLDSLAMRADFKNFSSGVDKAFEKAAKFTLNEQAEQFTRFVSADVMRQLTDPLLAAGSLSLKEQNAYISVFTNRVQGNYITSQRPILFQGVLGSAVSLFQTYSFNLLQQLLRHVENRDKRAVATLFGMQAGTFGLNGTPLFEAVNTHLIGNSAINQGHYDAYSVAPAVFGKEIGDWMMYGTASAFPAFGNNWPALYSRGDINPRFATVIPTRPQDVPAVDAAVRLVGNIANTGSKLLAGGALGETLLQGLEHNGINRPLAGFAQVLNGKSTTSKGSLISASNDFDLVTTASRILGAKPMDEAIALNNQYRLKSYQAADTDRMELLGERVKSYLYKNQFPPDEVMDGFMRDYAKVGGRMENFSSAMQRWSKNANASTVEAMRAKMQSSTGQRLSEIMGGEPLADYRNQPEQLVDLGPPEAAVQ